MSIDGATGVVYAEPGFPPPLCRGLFVLSRSVGALAHAFEEMQSGQRNKGPIPRHLIWQPDTWSAAARAAVKPTKARRRAPMKYCPGKETRRRPDVISCAPPRPAPAAALPLSLLTVDRVQAQVIELLEDLRPGRARRRLGSDRAHHRAGPARDRRGERGADRQ